jgi:membrane protease YdiL (CAAX protease family)
MFQQEHPILYYGGMDVCVSIASLLICRYVLGIKGGNAASKSIAREIRNDPIKFFFTGVIVFPLVEEIIFRGIPEFFLWMFSPTGNHWIFGIIVSAVFAAVHGFEDEKGNPILPLPQFAGGLVLWYVMRQYGLCYAFAVHALTNSLALVMAVVSGETK